MIYVIIITLVLLIIMLLVKSFTNKNNNPVVEFINKTNNGYKLNSKVIPNSSVNIDRTKRDTAWYNTKYNSFAVKNNNRSIPLKSVIKDPNTKSYKRVAWRNSNITKTIDNTKLFPFIDKTTGEDLDNTSKISKIIEKSKEKRETLSKKKEQQETKPKKISFTPEQLKERIKLNEMRSNFTANNAHEAAKMLANVDVYKGNEKNTDNILRLDNAVANRRPFNYITGKYVDEE